MNDTTSLRCPDCLGRIEHDSTCWIPLALDALEREDRAWLEDRGATCRVRPIEPAELADLRARGRLVDHEAIDGLAWVEVSETGQLERQLWRRGWVPLDEQSTKRPNLLHRVRHVVSACSDCNSTIVS